MSDSTDIERSLTDEYVQVLNERRLDDLEPLFAPTFRSHLRIGDIIGVEAFQGVMELVYEGFPGLVYQIDECIYSPGRAVIRYHFDAVHRGPYLGIPPSHRMVHLEGVEVLHIRDGLIEEIWNFADVMGLAAQLRAADPLAMRMEG